MQNLFALELEDISAGGNKLWFDCNGNVFYGKNEDNLISAKDAEFVGSFPKLCVADLSEAFMLGQRVVSLGYGQC